MILKERKAAWRMLWRHRPPKVTRPVYGLMSCPSYVFQGRECPQGAQQRDTPAQGSTCRNASADKSVLDRLSRGAFEEGCKRLGTGMTHTHPQRLEEPDKNAYADDYSIGRHFSQPSSGQKGHLIVMLTSPLEICCRCLAAMQLLPGRCARMLSSGLDLYHYLFV